MMGTHFFAVSQNNVVAVNRQPIDPLTTTRARLGVRPGRKNRKFCRGGVAEFLEAIQGEDISWTGRGKGGKGFSLGGCKNLPQCLIVYRDVLRHKLDSSFEILETPIPGSVSLFKTPRQPFFGEDEKSNPNPRI